MSFFPPTKVFQWPEQIPTLVTINLFENKQKLIVTLVTWTVIVAGIFTQSNTRSSC